MVIRIDNRIKKHTGRNIALGMILGIVVSGVGVYLFNHWNEVPIIETVTNAKNIIVDQVKNNNLITASPPDNNLQQVLNANNPVTSDNSQPVTQPIQSTNQIDITTLEHQIADQINQIRVQNGQKTLVYDDKLALVAREHSQDMISNNYFDHTSPTGITLQNRLFNAKMPCWANGENIEENYASTSNLLQSIISEWMNSEDHKQNILNAYYTHNGIGIAQDGDNLLITDDFC